MKRAPIVLAGTGLGLAGVLGYHATKPSALPSTKSSAQTTSASAQTGTSSSSASTRTTASTNNASSSQSGTRSATGEDVQFQYGDIQLKVTMSASRITNVSVAQLNVDDPRSDSIDQGALPQLEQETLSAQSAQIDAVSGASYTSQAYEQSLQSALDKLGVSSSSGSSSTGASS